MKKDLEKIAREELGLDTLEARNRDHMDFKEQAVWAIKIALERAYNAGKASVKEKLAPVKRSSVVVEKAHIKRAYKRKAVGDDKPLKGVRVKRIPVIPKRVQFSKRYYRTKAINTITGTNFIMPSVLPQRISAEG